MLTCILNHNMHVKEKSHVKEIMRHMRGRRTIETRAAIQDLVDAMVGLQKECTKNRNNEPYSIS